VSGRRGDHGGGALHGAPPAGVASPEHERDMAKGWSVWGSRSPAAAGAPVSACLFRPFDSHLLQELPPPLGKIIVLEPPAGNQIIICYSTKILLDQACKMYQCGSATARCIKIIRTQQSRCGRSFLISFAPEFGTQAE
jgi:hypothetical protein